MVHVEHECQDQKEESNAAQDDGGLRIPPQESRNRLNFKMSVVRYVVAISRR